MTDAIIGAVDFVWKALPQLTKPQEVQQVVVREVKEMLPQYGRNFVRLAGLSGAIAVSMGAYGAHAFKDRQPDPKLQLTYDTGNRYHFLHTLALLAVPWARRPYLVGGLIGTGMVLFSGSCYYHALTGNLAVRKVTPYGGMLLIAGWVAFIL